MKRNGTGLSQYNVTSPSIGNFEEYFIDVQYPLYHATSQLHHDVCVLLHVGWARFNKQDPQQG